ncbi:hypothetical protein [Nocardiopsis ansamitocini]|uniref:Chaplin domain-containing protein n=1 Tax=Nocardiopsis ansamitocini TaxID=1670832 RepID=A0A9W6UHV0_9ACTN|nr:hypothetical protein [Nocardiopsis ansamitocini]GLU49261.1 hypothetical protein Nans01_36120 [Nocardiopsis ansamitocini]
MLRKIAVAGLIAGAAMAFSAAPALAGDQTFNQNLQLVPITVCNANVAVLGATVPVLSPQSTGDCTNGPIQTVLQAAEGHHGGGHGHHHGGDDKEDYGY